VDRPVDRGPGRPDRAVGDPRTLQRGRAFVLTLPNPATIFSFIAIFGALGARWPRPARISRMPR
jgi:hypothetical protein